MKMPARAHSRAWVYAFLTFCAPSVAAFWILGAELHAQTATETILHYFGRDEAENPSGVIRDPAGNLYGTDAQGGPQYLGTIYQVSRTGAYRTLYTFSRGAEGWNPSQIIRDENGNLYGTAAEGGALNGGVIFRLDPAGNYSVLYSFTGYASGSYPTFGVVRDTAGNLYGTATDGGAYGAGVIYRLDPAGDYQVLYSFAAGPNGSVSPSRVTLDSAGNLYGTTVWGGAKNYGMVYELDAAGNFTILFSFRDKADGGFPSSGLLRDGAGNLYGVTSVGGTADKGVVYKIDASGHFKVLYNFQGGNDGGSPEGDLIQDSAGNLYGTTTQFGSAGEGVVYKLDRSGVESVLLTFTGANGSRPEAGVIQDAAGNLYGSATGGGPRKAGVLFTLNSSGQETVLYSFPGGKSAIVPSSGLSRDAKGDFYGTAEYGGIGGAGLLYKLDAAGSYTILHEFTGGADGGEPWGDLAIDAAGNIYGTAPYGGITTSCTDTSYPDGCGVIYKVDSAGKFAVLHAFTGEARGWLPFGGVTLDSAGNLYGTTYFGTGVCFVGQGCGVIYKLDRAGIYTVLYTFSGPDGQQPFAGVTLDSAGNLYGTASAGGSGGQGLVYELDAAGNYKVLYSFTGGSDGGEPLAGVIRDAAGNLYGTTYAGGPTACPSPDYFPCGVVYKLDATGHETVLHTFTGGPDGGQPMGGLVADRSGNLYGTNITGGAGGGGVLYQISAAGDFSTLFNFECSTTGCEPDFSLWRDASGNLFGTASEGGKRNTGVVFQVVTQ